jgi:S1-C subfamily serine protease
MDGEVIGVNTAIIQGAQGLSFSVDINTAKEVASQLIKDGRVFRAYLGLMLQEVNINIKVKHHYNLPNEKGLFITKLEENSPGSRSQLLEGDIIVAFNNKAINTSHELFKELSKKDILKPIDISVIRHSERLNFTIVPQVKQK